MEADFPRWGMRPPNGCVDGACSPISRLPGEMPEWRANSERCRLELIRDWGVALSTRRSMHPSGIMMPSGLGRLPPSGAQDPLFEGFPSGQVLRSLWSISKSMRPPPSAGRLHMSEHAGPAHDSPVKAIRAHPRPCGAMGGDFHPLD